MRSDIAHNLHAIKKQLPASVTLVAVSKTKPKEAILQAYEAGHRDFGENYVQELADKHEQLPKDIRWHFIGHLQSNKVKYIVPFVHLIHGVDSFKLLKEIDKQARKQDRVVDCLLQLHVAREETKFGFSFEECEAMLRMSAFAELNSICVRGFMAMASNTDDGQQVRAEFSSVRQFARELASAPEKYPSQNFQPGILSYGMSSDYRIALEEGSTMVRIGSSVFGAREYPK